MGLFETTLCVQQVVGLTLPHLVLTFQKVFEQKLWKCLKTLCILVTHDTSLEIQSTYCYATITLVTNMQPLGQRVKFERCKADGIVSV
jgi:hypothetical protein